MVYCAICLEDKASDECSQTTFCDHQFCTSCYDAWTSTHATCPLCRSPTINTASQFLPYHMSVHNSYVERIRQLPNEQCKLVGIEYLRYLLGGRNSLPVIPVVRQDVVSAASSS